MSNFVSYEAVEKFVDSVNVNDLDEQLNNLGVISTEIAVEHFSNLHSDTVKPTILDGKDSVSLFYSRNAKYVMEEDNPLDDESYAKVKTFRSAIERDTYLSDKNSSHYYFLDRYSHGSDHYSVSGTVSYPDQQWDVAHKCAVLEIGEDLRGLRKALVKKNGEDGNEKFILQLNNTLDRYSSYINGQAEELVEMVISKENGEIDVNVLGMFFQSEDLKLDYAHNVFNEMAKTRIEEIKNEIVEDTSENNLKGFDNNIMRKGSTSVDVFKHTSEDGLDSKMAIVSFPEKVVVYVKSPGGLYSHLEPKNEREVSPGMMSFSKNNNLRNFASSLAASEFMENALRYNVENTSSGLKMR